MSKEKDTDDKYPVGYGKPPKHTQFRPGKSGNSKGRRKGVHNFMTDVKRTLMASIKVKEAGRSRKISTQEGVLMMLREKALKGDARALDSCIELAGRFNNDPSEIGPTQSLAADDQAILDAFKKEVAADIGLTLLSQTDEVSSDQPKELKSSRKKEDSE
jgi:hypothetical protein